MKSVDVFVIGDTLPYSRQSFQNRCRIRTAGEGNWMWLTVPVGAGAVTTPIKDVTIATDRWRGVHRKSFTHHLASAPFWSHYLPEISHLLGSRRDQLGELTATTVEWSAAAIGSRARIARASRLDGAPSSVGEILKTIQASRLVTLRESADADWQTAESLGVEVSLLSFLEKARRQNFPSFVPDCSALDLLANHGPDTQRILAAGIEQ